MRADNYTLDERIALAGDSVDRIGTLVERESGGIAPRRVSISEMKGRVSPVDMKEYAEQLRKEGGAMQTAGDSSARTNQQDHQLREDKRLMKGSGNREEDPAPAPQKRVSVTDLDVPDNAKARVQKQARDRDRDRTSFVSAEGMRIHGNIEDKMDMLAKSPRNR